MVTLNDRGYFVQIGHLSITQQPRIRREGLDRVLSQSIDLIIILRCRRKIAGGYIWVENFGLPFTKFRFLQAFSGRSSQNCTF